MPHDLPACRFPVVLVALCFLGTGERAAAATLDYELTALSANRWEYAYIVTNDFAGFAIEEFTVFFDSERYGNLSISASPSSWDSIVVQPDLSLEEDGFFDSVSFFGGVAEGGVASGFRVAFDFLASGVPGSQPFEIVDPVTLEVLESDQTMPVPELTVAWLAMAAALLSLRLLRRVAAVSLAASMLAGSASALDVTGQAHVAALERVSSARISRTVFEFIYRIRVTNVGEELGGVIATLSSLSPATEVVDMHVEVGDIPAGGTVSSNDTFTIRHDRTVPFDPSALSWTIDARSMVPSALRINEVRFSPLPANAPFAELWNSGTRPLSLGTFQLRNERGDVFALPGSVTLAPGGFALVLFDGGSGVSGGTIHANDGAFLDAANGELVMLGPSGFAVDRVAWGPLASGSATQNGGGFSDDPPAGSSIARAPALSAPGVASWAVTSPERVTPGLSNPGPEVLVLLPYSGAIVPGPQVDVSWYPVPGAAQYRVQIAADSAYSNVVGDQIVSAPQASVPGLSQGTYFWRVQALAPQGPSVFSESNEITVEATIGASATSSVSRLGQRLASLRELRGSRRAHKSRQLSAVGAAAAGAVLLSPLSQHKDSPLLLLESRNEHGAHGWAADHQVFDPNDPADNMNCAAASIAMVNRLFGGRISQDRIGFEVFRNRQPGPEQDLSYGGSGFNVAQVGEGLAFALGAPAQQGSVTTATQDLFWQLLQREIDAGRPIVLGALRRSGQGHATVLVAYNDATGERRITHADPWSPGSSVGKLEQLRYSSFVAGQRAVYFWTLPSQRSPASDEPEMTRDSDSDGVVDFDETRRFGTDPFDRDTDGDFVGDFADIRASVFDRQFGYSLGGNVTRVDIDGDGAQMELDADSDGDRCSDGQEDFTLNGDFEPALAETHNFYGLDLRCRRWIGTSTYDWRLKIAPFTRIRATGRIEWVPTTEQSPFPEPVSNASFVSEGDLTVDLYSVLGCRFGVSPNRVALDDSGTIEIDYTTNPPQVTGSAGGGLFTMLTNCRGDTFPDFIGATLFTTPVSMNEFQDEITGTARISDAINDLTVEMNYHLGPRPQVR
jgi:hypothetical protein